MNEWEHSFRQDAGPKASSALVSKEETCIHCETLRELEEGPNRLGGMVVYELEFPEKPSEEDRQWLEDTLPHFDYYPALFIVKADEIVCVEINDLSEFDEEIVPQIIEANGGNHEGHQ